MSEDTTTTDAPVKDDGVEEPAQPESTDQAEAEVTQDTTTTSTNDEGESQQANTDDLKKWASAKGLDIDTNNPTEVKLAQMQREAEKKMHESTQQASQLRSVVNEEVRAAQAGIPEDDYSAQTAARLQAIEVNQAINDFYAQNPEARKYDEAMAQLVRENPQLAQGGLEALFAVAKVRELDNGGKEQIKAEGGQEALKQLATKQKAAAPSANATSYKGSTGEVTLEEVARRTADHDIAWLREHEAEINAL